VRELWNIAWPSFLALVAGSVFISDWRSNRTGLRRDGLARVDRANRPFLFWTVLSLIGIIFAGSASRAVIGMIDAFK
jgi:hypothetical protein